jgi:hypothetical protein
VTVKDVGSDPVLQTAIEHCMRFSVDEAVGASDRVAEFARQVTRNAERVAMTGALFSMNRRVIREGK